MSGPSSTSAFFDRIEARAFSRATEVPERVKSALLNLIPEDIHEHIIFTEELTEGHHKNPIQIMSIELGDGYAEKAIRHIFSKLPKEDIEELFQNFDRRLDESCTFFLRIDKQAAYLGYIELARVPDVISCQFHIMKYPRCKPAEAKVLLEEYSSHIGAHSE
jgi:RNA binding exosome subunit